MDHIRTIEWRDGRVRLVDQTKLPGELVHVETDDYRRLGESIKRLEVRGAPAIGVAGAMGVALAALECDATSPDELACVRARGGRASRGDTTDRRQSHMGHRPVARAFSMTAPIATADAIRDALVAEAIAILEEDRLLCRSIGRHGAALLNDGDGVLTHCNAGGLATAEYGTALAVIYTAVEEGKQIRVFADETRPLLQGARLTAWELMQHGIDVTLLCDSAAASAMARGWVDKVIVGADRIARQRRRREQDRDLSCRRSRRAGTASRSTSRRRTRRSMRASRAGRRSRLRSAQPMR